LSDEEYIEIFRNQFEEAVKLRLRADVPVGVYLSGGIDSCSILGTAAKLRGSNIKAFSIGFPDEAFDEAGIAKEMAEFAGADFNTYCITSELVAENFVESIKHGEIISVNPHSIAKFILSKHVREAGYKVVLTGEGSDEILGGYSHFTQDLVLYAKEYENMRNSGSLPDTFDRYEGAKDLVIPLIKADDNNTLKRRLGFIPSWLGQFLNTVSVLKSFFTEDVLSRYKKLDAYGVFLDGLDVHNHLKDRHVLNQSMYTWSKSYLPGYLLSNLGDRMEMGHSVEGRVPFLDHKLVELAATLPISLKIHNMTEKYILREAARPVITQTVYQRKKHPFIAPPSSKKNEDPFYIFIHEYIGDHLKDIPLFNMEKVSAHLAKVHKLSGHERMTAGPFMMIMGGMVAMQEQFGLRLR
ncbi:MAG TPA: asparagine synthase C-terminal domain-containing protein, partial [Ruminiclostridium sp.]|nr:asparagine synthase C-terminal domain-containing protein [Ruminiclostridium sp.]